MIHLLNASAIQAAIHPCWVTLSGPDAKDFLHRLTSTNVRALELGQGAKGCFLTPQGKIRAYFTLWHFGPADFAFEMQGGTENKWKKELLTAIDQYTFAEKIVVADVGTLECRWIFVDTPASASFSSGSSVVSEADTLTRLGAPKLAAGQTIAVDEEIRLCHQGDRDFGRPWMTAWGRPARLAQWLERALPEAQELRLSQLEQWRVRAMRPQLDAEITPNTIPLEVGLIDALAQGKGCYPGQEVIERIVSLGSPARRLALLEGTGELPFAGDAILNLSEQPAEVGQVTSVVANLDEPGRFMALGFLRKIHAKTGLEVRFARGNSQASVTRVAPYV